MLSALVDIGKEYQCLFIQLEPNVEQTPHFTLTIPGFNIVSAAHPLFTKYTFILDLLPSEEELLKNMHQKN
jgi:hypothetical protein